MYSIRIPTVCLFIISGEKKEDGEKIQIYARGCKPEAEPMDTKVDVDYSEEGCFDIKSDGVSQRNW